MNYAKIFVEEAQSTLATQERITALMILMDAPEEFYASDLGLAGHTMNSLRMIGVVREVRGKDRDAFICINEREGLYRKVQAHCWTLNVKPEVLRGQLMAYCKEMADVYASTIILLNPFR